MYAAQLRLAPARASRTLVQRRLLNTSPARLQQVPPPPPPAAAGAAAATINQPPKKSVMRRLVFWTTLGLLVFYPTSAYISTQNESYRDLFIKMPGGEWLADYADDNGWDQFGPGTVTQQVVKLTSAGKEDVQAKIAEARKTAEEKAHDAAAWTKTASTDAQKRMEIATNAARQKADELSKSMLEKADELRSKASSTADDVAAKAKDAGKQAKEATDRAIKRTSAAVDHAIKDAREATDDVVKKAEDAVSTSPYPDTAKPRALHPETVKPQRPTYEGQEKYGESLPIGFEPPPGYYIPPPPPKPKTEEGKLPQLSLHVKEISGDEPIIAQLASTIDSLTTSLSTAKGQPSSQAADILARAQGDLAALNSRLDEVKKSEKERLQKTVDAKTVEFERELAKKEKEWQKDEVSLKSSWEAERQKMIDGWRHVLDTELESQRHLIEERLREEVVSQGIELQRRWLRSIKSQVETERGGRLAKLDSLTTSLKQLERITLDNSAALDDNVRLHKIWSALRAVQTKADKGNLAFDDEVRVLQALSTPTDPDGAAEDDTVMRAALAQLEQSGIPHSGVKSFAELSSWFTNSVAPRIHEASLVPPPEEATVANHIASAVLSKILFRPQAGLVAGEEVDATLARAEYALGEKDLDAAAREINNLNGWPRKLAEDWLREARRKLEVQQALDVFATEATLSSLLMV